MTTQIEVDIFNTKSFTNALQWLYDNIDKQANEMLEEITKSGQQYLDKRYSTARGRDSNIEDLSTNIKIGNNDCELIAKGKDVLYEEFGTGDMGKQNPHPVKSDYNLNDYNSGPYIKNVSDYDENSYVYDDLQEFGITSGKFWRYSKDSTNTIYYTQGVSAGQEVWDTRNYLINEEIPKIVQKRGKIINDNIIRSIKN